MPAYNVENYIVESIKSVQKQTYQDWELIVINDGSTDETLKVVEELLEDYRIKLINKPNEGVSKARNIGINNAAGEYLTFLDSDDLWDSTFLEKTFNLIEKENLEMVYSGYDFLCEDGTITSKSLFYTEGKIENFIQIKGFVLPMMLQSMMVKKSLIEKQKICFSEESSYGEDVEFILRVLLFSKVKAVKEKLFRYRRRSFSSTQSSWSYEKFKQDFDGFQRVIKFIKQNYNGKDMCFIQQCEEVLAYRKYRYLWGLMKNGYYDDVEKFIGIWEKQIRLLLNLPLRINRKIQCKILLLKNVFVWKIIKKISR